MNNCTKLSARRIAHVFTLIATLIGAAGCKPRSRPIAPDAGPPSSETAAAGLSSDAGAATEVPVPPEPPPALPAKASEAPALQTKLLADKAYSSLWDYHQADERRVLLTAVSEFLSAGTLYNETAADLKQAHLSDEFGLVQKIYWRTGTIPDNTRDLAEKELRGTAPMPNHGTWFQRMDGAPTKDFSALAMWLHPNDPTYVRERMIALAKGPFPDDGKGPIARAWLANIGQVINRLRDMHAFRPEDCAAIGAELREKVMPDGTTVRECTAPRTAATSKTADKDWSPTTSASGEVIAVTEYLKRTLDDPDSYQYDECTNLHGKNGIWQVDCSYRAKNRMGALVRERQRFLLGPGGPVGEGQVVTSERL